MNKPLKSAFAEELDKTLQSLYGKDLDRAIQALKQDPAIKLFLTGDANAPDLPVPIKKDHPVFSEWSFVANAFRLAANTSSGERGRATSLALAYDLLAKKHGETKIVWDVVDAIQRHFIKLNNGEYKLN